MTRDERMAMTAFTGGVWGPGQVAMLLTLMLERPVDVTEAMALVDEYNREAGPVTDGLQNLTRAEIPFWRGTR